jgi:PAS domain S-box-containing protein
MPSDGRAVDKVNILLVDDQPAKLLSYEVVLGELGENLIKAGSPQEALGILLRTDDVAVVLIDVVMPGLDGFQLAEMIREHPRFEKLAIIFVSAVQINDADHLRGYQIGAVDYVSVPVVPEVLRAKVNVFVELYRKTRQLEQLNLELERRVTARTAELEAQTERLRRSEERRSLALSAGNMGSWELDIATGHLLWDEGQYGIYGVTPDAFVPTRDSVLEMLHPDDRATSAIGLAQKLRSLQYSGEFRIVRPNGELRWCLGSAAVTRGADGVPVRLTGVSVDITERKRAEERQVLLAREVDHRAKNTLAVVLSVLRLTKARTMREFTSAVEGRIQALAATHNLLSASRWEGANLRQIVGEELAPYRTGHRDRVVTEGPAAILLPATAQAVALALHELATNSAKYGALSREGGRLHVSWTVEANAMVLDWREVGGPPTAMPSSLGFGLTIVRSSIEEQFRGGVAYHWHPEGLHCRLSIPRAQLAELREPRACGPAVQTRPALRGDVLAGKRILLVEDEFLVRLLIERIVVALGATVVGPFGRLADGLAAARREELDCAILDLNLGGESATPLADILAARGLPFLFVTGYQRDSIDRRYANVPVMQKPVDAEALKHLLASLINAPPRLSTVQAG